MSKSRIVEIDLDTARGLWELAEGRNSSKPKSSDRKRSPLWKGVTVDYLGLKGEHGAAAFLGVEYDRGIYLTGDAGFDLVLPNGVPAIVKFNHRRGGYFMIERERDFVHPIGILVDGECAPPERCDCPSTPAEVAACRVRVVGWIHRDRFWKQRHVADWGLGTRWYVYQRELNDAS